MAGAARLARPRADATVLRRARPADPQEAAPSALDEPAAAGVPLWERAFMVGALLAQQDAFLNILRIQRGMDAADPDGDLGGSDPVSSALVLLTFLALAALFVRHRAQVLGVLRRNGLSLALAGLAFLSAAWSVEAGLTIKRSFVYLVSLGLPLYMAARLGFDAGVRVAALAFAIAAAASLAVGAAVPAWGVMHFAGVEGDWRGVFTHKNPLAQSMLIGAILEAYLIAHGPRRWVHVGVLGVELLLILLSNSITALVVGTAALAVFGGFLVMRRGGQLRRATVAAAALAAAALSIVVIFFPQALEKASGRDATLTGRTELWPAVLQAAAERPFTGWGFQAFWQPDNPRAQDLWTRIGWLAPNSHNGFLDIALGLGPLGVILTAGVVAQMLGRCGRLMREPVLALAGMVGVVMLGAILVRSLTEAVLARPSDIDWVVFNLLGLMAAEAWRHGRPAPVAPPTPGPAALRRARPI